MFKRFILGLAVGCGLMYYYLHHGDDLVQGAKQWGTHAASHYRGDQDRHIADKVLGGQHR